MCVQSQSTFSRENNQLPVDTFHSVIKLVLPGVGASNAISFTWKMFSLAVWRGPEDCQA